MKKLTLTLFAFIFLLTIGCKEEKKTTTDSETKIENESIDKIASKEEEKEDQSVTLKILLTPKSDSKVSGNVTFISEGEMVTMTAKLEGLSEGAHAIHIHEKADCSSVDGKSAGGHWNPTMEPHGKWGAKEGYHKGDIGNFTVTADGKGAITFATNDWCIGCGDEKKDVLGKGIIVHQGTDDFTSQPSGAAGSRVSCGGIIQ